MVTVVTHWTHEPTFASSMLHITATNGIVLRNAGLFLPLQLCQTF